MLTTTQKVFLTHCYFVHHHDDPHSAFATLLMVTRDEAKRLYFEFMFGDPAMQRHNNGVRAATYAAMAAHANTMEQRLDNAHVPIPAMPAILPQAVANPLVENEDAW